MSKEADGSSKEKQETVKREETDELLRQERKINEDLLTKIKYLQADFENYRKRAENEMQAIEELSVRGLVTRLLSVLDELELAVANSVKPDGGKAVSEGIRMVHRNLNTVMKTVGLKKIEAVGMPFDPKLHEAVEKSQGSAEKDVVVEEIRSGYTFRGQLLRPSMVKVELALKKADEPEAKADE